MAWALSIRGEISLVSLGSGAERCAKAPLGYMVLCVLCRWVLSELFRGERCQILPQHSPLLKRQSYRDLGRGVLGFVK